MFFITLLFYLTAVMTEGKKGSRCQGLHLWDERTVNIDECCRDFIKGSLRRYFFSLLNLTSMSSAESGAFREKWKSAFVFPSCRWTSTDAGNAWNIVASDVGWLNYSALSVDVVVCIIVAPRKCCFFCGLTQQKFFFSVFLAKTASHPPLVWL